MRVDRKKIKMMTLQLTVPNMACSACAETITKAVHAIDPSAIIKADPQTKLVEIETQIATDAIAQAITDAGYSVS